MEILHELGELKAITALYGMKSEKRLIFEIFGI